MGDIKDKQANEMQIIIKTNDKEDEKQRDELYMIYMIFDRRKRD